MRALLIPVRFFKYDFGGEQVEITEITESEFLSFDSPILYERHTMFDHGVNQICLTKTDTGE